MEIHSREANRNKFDKVLVGLAVAFLVPMIVFIFYWYLTLYPAYTLGGVFKDLQTDMLMKIFTLCASPDLLVVLLFTRRNMNNAAKGMTLAIILMILVTVITKL
ncbi:MAG: hypothetical protein MJZ61_03700 [Bacteroidales bacterium]|nr:hypothetical protein [Bacteroidales bacterium]